MIPLIVGNPQLKLPNSHPAKDGDPYRLPLPGDRVKLRGMRKCLPPVLEVLGLGFRV